MADKELYKKISAIKKKLSEEQAGRTQWADLLPDAEQAPGEESEALAAEIRSNVSQHDATIATLQGELAALEQQLPKQPEPAAPKFDPEKHPLLRKTIEKAEPAKPTVFNAGDLCEALWTDKQWYKAKIQTVMGSVADPKYRVRFIDYDDTTTVGRDSIRSLPSENKKRKAEAAAPINSPIANSPHVISGPASINPEALAAKKEPAPEQNAPQNRRKIGGHKALERKANDWKSFTSKGVGKKISQKDSMFRSGTGVNSRVGFTGSGAGMTQTTKRVRYSNKDQDDEDDEGGLQRNTMRLGLSGRMGPPMRKRR